MRCDVDCVAKNVQVAGERARISVAFGVPKNKADETSALKALWLPKLGRPVGRLTRRDGNVFEESSVLLSGRGEEERRLCPSSQWRSGYADTR